MSVINRMNISISSIDKPSTIDGEVVHFSFHGDHFAIWFVPYRPRRQVKIVGTGETYKGRHLISVSFGDAAWHLIEVQE